MPEKISWTINVQVIGGPKLSASQTREVEASGLSCLLIYGRLLCSPPFFVNCILKKVNSCL